VATCGYREDVYIRPIAYKSGEVIGPKLDGVEDDFMVFAIPFGKLSRSRCRHPLPDLDVAAGARHVHPCPRQSERTVRELGAR
jgi:hypothetical protein